MARDYFTRVRREFPRYVWNLRRKPITYVEIGCWLGGSAHFVASRILRHPQSKGFGIDPYVTQCRKFPPDEMLAIQQQAKAKLQPFEDAGKWTWVVGRSQEVLPTWPHGKIDLLYIDGSHHAHDVVLDFCSAWPHLHEGSRVIFDDYGVGIRKRGTGSPPEVPDAVDAILATFGILVRTIGCNKQFALEVASHPLPGMGLSRQSVRLAYAEGRITNLEKQ